MVTRAAWAAAALLACALAAAAARPPQDPAKEKLKTALKDNDVVGEWFYDDIHGAFAQARKSGRPILAVLRCVPSGNYREIDKQVARRETPGMAELLDKFVCVRIVQAHGLDLATFQFDTDLTWAVFFLNADKVVYGRYGHRCRQKEPHKDVSIDAFKKAARAALELHEGYPKNKKELAGKTVPAEWRLPELIPELKSQPDVKASDGKNCVRCHLVHEGELWSSRAPKQTLPDRLIWPFPMPETVGLTLDPKEMATVASVEADTPAEKAGFKAGDRIARMEGQPILSIADVQWVLNNVRDGVPVKVEAEIERDGKKTELTMTLPPAWRHKSDPSWRPIVPGLKHRLLGVDTFEAVAPEARKENNLPPSGMALRVKKVGTSDGRNTSFTWKTGDVLISLDGRNAFDAEYDLVAHLLRKNPGQKVDFLILRDGRPQKGTLVLP